MVAIAPGIFRRKIIVDATGNSVFAAIEDDFHHYEIVLTHDHAAVTATKATSRRTPFVTCAEAGGQLALLTGHPISTRPTGLPDPHHQCTHMFELAVIALAQAVRGGRREYDVAVPYRVLGGQGSATLHCDGKLLFDWVLDGDVVTAPAEFAGSNIRTLARWAEAHCDDEALEAVRVIRRGIHVSSGRSATQHLNSNAVDLKQVRGACYVFQPERVEFGVRGPDKPRDFSTDAAAPLRNFIVH